MTTAAIDPANSPAAKSPTADGPAADGPAADGPGASPARQAGRSLRSVNQNLLPVLRELLQSQNLSRAAVSLHLTQPSVSAALTQLRASLGDPLLVRVGRRMALTPRARELPPAVERACAAMSAVWDSAPFDPAHSQRRFVIASVDYGPLLLAPPLVAQLDREAPGIGLQFVQFSAALAQRQRIGDIDFLFVTREAIDALAQPDLQVQPLFTDPFVAVVGPGHPLARSRRVSPSRLAQHAHALFYPGLGVLEGYYGAFDPPSAADPAPVAGAAIVPPALRVEQFGLLPLLAVLTGRVAILPTRIVEQMKGYVDLVVVGDPLPAKASQVVLAWSPIHDADPAHRWLRERLQALFAPPAVAPLAEA